MPLRKKILVGLMMGGEAVGAGLLGLGEYLSVFPIRGMNDFVTGYWSKESDKLTREYLNELEAEKQSS